MDALLTVGEVAAILKVDPNTVYEKGKSGEIPSVRTANTSVRFIESDIRKWLEGHSRPSSSRPLFEDSLQTDLSLASYDKLFLKGGARVSPEGKTWNYPFGSVYVRLNKSGQERWYIYYRVDGIRIRKAVKNAQSRADALKILQLEVADAFRGQHGLKKPEKANFRETILSMQEEEALLKRCFKRLLPIVQVALNTGMRRGEILGLRWSQVGLAVRTNGDILAWGAD